ncbi:MAG: hypothetical protein GXO06_01215, partial [Epsilonproteobacteria bacterium]|nr:hypothetical protein [Campylobacterota bacterium]
MKKRLLGSILIALQSLYADITGNVFKDIPVNGNVLNTYGVKDANEKGIANLTIKGVDENGKSVSVVTDSNGDYRLSGLSGKVRIEVEYPSYLKESPQIGSANSAVRFVQDGDSGVDFAFYEPLEYVNTTNPRVVAPIFLHGSTKSGTTSGDAESIIYWNYLEATKSDLSKNYAKASETGALWGVAYSKKEDAIFTSAVVRRHMGLGPLGIGGVYKVSGALSTTPKLEQWLDITTLGVDLGSVNRDSSNVCYKLEDDINKPSYDLDGYVKVGRVGIGDIDLSDDESTLYVMDLNNKQLLFIDVATKKLIKKVAIPNPGCSDGDYRPWAIYPKRGLLVGVVCSAETSQDVKDLKAHIMQYDGTTFNSIYSFNLNYERGYTINDNPAEWQPWTTDTTWHGDSHPEPILSDIEIDEKGDMILAFVDRYGMITSNNNYSTNCEGGDTSLTEGHAGGEILRACYNGVSWELESNGACGGVTTDGVDNGQGVDGGEYYVGDSAGADDSGLAWNHQETSSGSLLQLTGSGQVMVSVFDPIDPDTGGVKVLSNTTGHSDIAKEVYPSEETKPITNSDIPHYMGKSVGIGDIEFLSAAPPLEVGNRVWDDINKNGIQDANEPGISEVRVDLVCNGELVATATTDSNGYYIFSSDTTKASTASHRYGVLALEPSNKNNCLIRIADYANQTALLKKAPTSPLEGDNIQLDSNGIEKDGDLEAFIEPEDISGAGINNHTYDFGFKKLEACIGDYVWIDSNVNGIQDDNESGVDGIKVYLYKEDNASFELTTTTADGGKYKFCGLEAGTYKVKFDLNSLPPHYSVTEANKGDDTKDSDIDSSSGESPLISVEEGDENLTIDMGIYKRPCIGDYVWLDKNGNGIQDGDEVGIEGVSIELLDSNGDSFSPAIVTETNSSGYYEFCDLEIDSEYKVRFTPPAGYKETIPNEGDDSSDSDIEDGVVLAKVGVEDNRSVDAGFFKPACLGDRVWYDKNQNGLQEDTEVGVADVVVYLLDEDGKELNSTKTDSSGKYQFCNLAPKGYKIQVDKPSGYEGFTAPNAGDESIDSDIDLATAQSGVVVLESGDNYMDLDAGLIKPPSSIDIEKYTMDREGDFNQADNISDSDVPVLIEGHKVVWKYIITNNGGQSLSGVEVIDSKEGAVTQCFRSDDNSSITLPASLGSGESIICY